MQGGAGEVGWQGASALLRSSLGVSFGPVKTDSGSLWVGCGPQLSELPARSLGAWDLGRLGGPGQVATAPCLCCSGCRKGLFRAVQVMSFINHQALSVREAL